MLSQLLMVFSIELMFWKAAEVEAFNLLEGIIPFQTDWGKTRFLVSVGVVMDRMALEQIFIRIIRSAQYLSTTAS